MSISRRLFISVGSFAAIAAGISTKPGLVALGQKLGVATPYDPLSFYTMATFLQYVNSVFTLRGWSTVELTLAKVQDTLPANTSRLGGRESFVLEFRGGTAQLHQDTYTIEHPALGTFKLFIVPGGTDENGASLYAATINRLAYVIKPNAPRKPLMKSSTTTSTRITGGPAPSNGDPAPEPKPGRTGKSERESDFNQISR